MTALTVAAGICRRFEGLYLAPYLCPAGIPTIGYGSTFYADGTRVTLSDRHITAKEAEILLEYTLTSKFLPGLMKACPALADSPRLGALLSFVYNLGLGNFKASTLRKRVNDGDWDAAAVELLKWDKAAGKRLKGLSLRRMVESKIILDKLILV